MKILLVSNTTWFIVNFHLSFIKVLIEEGHDVFVISPRDRYVNVLEATGASHIHIFMDNKGISPFCDFETIKKLFFCYRQQRFDVAFHFTIKPVIYGGLVARLLNISYVSTITGLGTVFIKKSWVTILVKFLYRISQKKVHCVFFLNYDDMAIFLRNSLVGKERVAIIPGSGIDVDYFKCEKPSSVESDGGKLIFLLVARMLSDKGVNEFVDAARLIRKKYNDVCFQLLGPVDVENNTALSRKVIDQWVAEGVVEYLPPVDDVRYFIAQADCVVLPSYREGLPRTLLEAAAMSKPLVATDTAGCRDVVIDGVNGYLCEVADAEDLARKLEIMINHSNDERLKMGEASRKHVVDNYGEERVIDCYLGVINRL